MDLESFLRTILGSSRGFLCIAKIHRLNGKGFSQVFFSYPKHLQDSLIYIHENDTYGVDLYFSPTLFSKEERKKEHVLPAWTLYADLDACHPRVLGRYGEPRPNIVVQTSEGHWQAYWLLNEVAPPAQIEQFNRRLAVAYKDDGCDQSGWDLTQLLRLPTKNWKRVQL